MSLADHISHKHLSVVLIVLRILPVQYRRHVVVVRALQVQDFLGPTSYLVSFGISYTNYLILIELLPDDKIYSVASVCHILCIL